MLFAKMGREAGALTTKQKAMYTLHRGQQVIPLLNKQKSKTCQSK